MGLEERTLHALSDQAFRPETCQQIVYKETQDPVKAWETAELIRYGGDRYIHDAWSHGEETEPGLNRRQSQRFRGPDFTSPEFSYSSYMFTWTSEQEDEMLEDLFGMLRNSLYEQKTYFDPKLRAPTPGHVEDDALRLTRLRAGTPMRYGLQIASLHAEVPDEVGDELYVQQLLRDVRRDAQYLEESIENRVANPIVMRATYKDFKPGSEQPGDTERLQHSTNEQISMVLDYVNAFLKENNAHTLDSHDYLRAQRRYERNLVKTIRETTVEALETDTNL